jgi:predicted RND superfamily exporter protein
MANLLEIYGEFLGRRPFLVLGICLLLFLLGTVGSGLVTQTVIDFSEQVPQDLESIQAFEFIGDEFGETGSSVIYAVEIDPDFRDSSEARDVRDPEIMAYIDLLGQKAWTLEQVISVRSAADLLKQANGGRLPRSGERIKEIIESAGEDMPSSSNPFDLFISSDYSIAALRITYQAADDFESEEVVDELLQIAAETSPPRGAKTTLTGGPVTNVVLFRQIGPTFALTGTLSFLGIFIVVVLIFYSLRYGLTSLLAIAFGSTWAFGFLGFTGFALNPNTSGALSLILGIGIDFGIQVVTRFRQELRRLDPRKAIANTMPRVILPMTISVLAIILGFKALSLGNLQFVGELGDIMALGVFMSYLAAITVIPAVLVILNTLNLKRLVGGK